MVEPPLDCQITSTPVISRPSASTSDGDLSKQYCSTLLQELEMQQTDSDSDSEVEQDFLPPHVITELIDEVKRVLLPDLEASQRQVEHVVQVTVTVPALQQQGIMKRKWGPVLATRHSTRINNQLHVLTKAQLLLQKKNLEIPPTFKGNSFTVLNADHLDSIASTVGLQIGIDPIDAASTIENLVNNEIHSCLNFANSNPEIALPESLDLDVISFSTDKHLSPGLSQDNSVEGVDFDPNSQRPCGSFNTSTP